MSVLSVGEDGWKAFNMLVSVVSSAYIIYWMNDIFQIYECGGALRNNQQHISNLEVKGPWNDVLCWDKYYCTVCWWVVDGGQGSICIDCRLVCCGQQDVWLHHHLLVLLPQLSSRRHFNEQLHHQHDKQNSLHFSFSSYKKSLFMDQTETGISTFLGTTVEHPDLRTTTNKCSICLWRTWVVFVVEYLMSPDCESDIPTKNNGYVSTDGLNTSLLLLLFYITFDGDLVDFCKFTYGSILYKKVVPAMWSPLRDHIAGDHMKTSSSM